MRVTSLDLSLTSTGACRLIAGSEVQPVTETFNPGKRDGHLRLQWILDNARLWTQGSDLCVVEGPSFGSPNKQHAIGGLWWMITHQLWAWKIPCVVVSPSQLKTYALGKGSGKGTDKDWVLAAVVRRYLEVAIAGNDEADALVLAAMAADHYGHPVVTVPETHRRALATVSWPDLEA
jgi:crossover junction endodeoxyribonuclease RuvC